MTRTPDDETMHPRTTRAREALARRLDVLLPDTGTIGHKVRRALADRLVEMRISPDRAARFAELCAADVLALARAEAAEQPPPPADPDQPCGHPGFAAVVAVGRIGEADPGNPNPGMPRSYMCEVVVRCEACGERFKFDGVPHGLSFTAPTVSMDATELRAPIYPESGPTPYQGATGFRVRGL